MIKYNEWVEAFHRDGYLVIPSVLTEETCNELKDDLDAAIYDGGIGRRKSKLKKRMFERSKANLELFWQDPVATFAETLIADNGSHDVKEYKRGIPSANETHVIHNNSFVINAGRDGLGGSCWHQDDTPHITSIDGQPLTNVRLNVLAITCLYYLTDVSSVENGPTQVIPGSHLFGRHCNGDITGLEDKIVSATGPVGTAVIINNQTWHRGSPNLSNRDRYCTQVTYAKRLIGHKYGNFIDYHMPKEVYNGITDPRKLRLLGFLGHGAYG
jgi:ectoine hydroxylase-related dioxygenase (phytanoyl-CoA dioxygenase family)